MRYVGPGVEQTDLLVDDPADPRAILPKQLLDELADVVTRHARAEPREVRFHVETELCDRRVPLRRGEGERTFADAIELLRHLRVDLARRRERIGAEPAHVLHVRHVMEERLT